jgi:peptide/nickel transport system substrate-binding protein
MNRSSLRFLPLLVALLWIGSAGAQGERPLRLAITGDEGTLTPYTYVTGYPGYELMTLIYDQLFLMDEGLVPRPWLAVGLEIVDDVTYVLELREGVRWHDGEPFTADDVAFTIAYYQAHPMGRFTSSANRVIDVQVDGESSVTLMLEGPDATFVEAVLADLPILPRHLWHDVDEPRAMAEAIGTGPYRLVEMRSEQFYRFEANPDFWGPPPAVETIIAPIVRDETTTFQALLAGEIDAAVRPVPAGSVASLQARPDLTIAQGSGFATTLLILDVTRPGLDDPAVRRVIAGAVDYGRMVDLLLLGFGTVGTPGFLHPENPFANPATAEPPRLSPAEARGVLRDAGYRERADGTFAFADGGAEGARLAFELLAPANNPTRLRAAELIAQDLAAAGIGVTVRSMESEALTQRVWPDFDVSQGRDYELAVFGWSAPVNARANLRGLLHGDPAKGTLNLAGYDDPEVNELADRAVATVDTEARRAVLWTLQERMARDVPLVPLFYQDGVFAYRPAAYDGWSYMAGQGILHKRSFLRR